MDLGGDVRANPKLSGTKNNVFGIQTGGATGVALAIKDNDGTNVDSGTDSKPYPVNATGETRLIFNAKYRSSTPVVTAGPVIANINFLVTLP